MDSDVPPAGTSNPPPPTRTAAMVDFRQADHVATRLGWFHAGRIQMVLADLSARAEREPAYSWYALLP